MEFEKGQLVLCTAGREKGKLMYVVKTDDDYVYLSDGKERPLSKPKRKNPKHLTDTGKRVGQEMLTDKMLKKTLLSEV
ncbi:MAG: KOW domain-containing RNA-binding protein [Clostridiales bacterium]|nr:KOW domain-containing RNA-binding protein [Clostridiales bacterium]